MALSYVEACPPFDLALWMTDDAATWVASNVGTLNMWVDAIGIGLKVSRNDTLAELDSLVGHSDAISVCIPQEHRISTASEALHRGRGHMSD